MKHGNSYKSEKGIYLVLTGAFVFVIILMAALMISSAFFSTSKVRVQNTANLGALAALESFFATRSHFNWAYYGPDLTVGFFGIPAFTISSYTTRARDTLSDHLRWNTLSLGLDFGEPIIPGEPAGAGVNSFVEFGNYYFEAPESGIDCAANNLAPNCTCSQVGKSYPCFVPNPPVVLVPFTLGGFHNNPTTNAVKVSLRNLSGTSNQLHVPIARLFGEEFFDVEASAIAAVVPRCSALLIDVSSSSVRETHTPWNPTISEINVGGGIGSGEPGLFFSDPSDLSKVLNLSHFAYNRDIVEMVNCEDPSQLFGPNGAELQTWCNTGAYLPDSGDPLNPWTWTIIQGGVPVTLAAGTYSYVRPVEWAARTVSNPALFPAPPVHFQSDYVPIDFQTGLPQPMYDGVDLLVDDYYQDYSGYFGPQPLSTFFLAFNAALRALAEQKVFTDSSILIGFNGLVTHMTPMNALTSDFRELVRRTNLMNRGVRGHCPSPFPPCSGASPDGYRSFATRWVNNNVVAAGVAPRFSELPSDPFPGSTNLQAIETAADLLSSSCPGAARKSIIIATDGIGSCVGDPLSPGGAAVNCSSSYSLYTQSRDNLLDTGSSGLLTKLKDNNISVTPIISGDYVRPHFINRFRSDNPDCTMSGSIVNEDNLECFVELPFAASYGDPDEFVSADSFDSSNNIITHNQAHNDVLSGARGAVFGQPMVDMATLAFETGGILCPLLPLAPGADTNIPTSTTSPDPSFPYIDHDLDGNGEGGVAPGSCLKTDCPPDLFCTPCILKSSLRPIGSVQNYSVTYESQFEQASNCAKAAIGAQPFTLVEDFN